MKTIAEIEEQIYSDFISIDANAFQEHIRYYENNMSDIKKLALEYQIYIEYKYAIACDELNNYYGFLSIIDELIIKVIGDNIFKIEGKDVYKDLLYRKAHVTHKVLDYYKSNHIFSELIKMEPDNKTYQKGYLINAIEQKRYEIKYLNAISIILFIVAATIICIELLMIRTFYSEWIQFVENGRNIVFIGGIFVLLIIEIGIRIHSYKALEKIKNK